MLLVIGLVVSGASFGEAIQYTSEITPKYFNDVWKKQYDMATRIDYDLERKIFDFYIKENLYLTGFTITRDQANSLIEAIDKYKEWNLKASSKKVMLEKEISKVNTYQTFWKVGNGDWNFGYGVSLSVIFFSQSDEIHQLVVSFPKFKNKYNEYSSHNPETIYLGYKEAMKLRDALTEKAVLGFIEKSKKQALIESEFN
ncbi:hypothetical protein [Oceanobacter kriegii]|uniref:hypothetical protein n=1 Tax=Oceanobacter kriegii TaxID=64972 RepID=UPI0012EB71CD|nr:hypothetical protein [Oceanobacter kriegii]